MHIRCTRHIQVCTHRYDELRVVPVGTFTHVSLVAPNLRERVREVGIPVVETHVHTAEQLQESRSCCVRQVRHRRNRSKSKYAVRPPLLCRVQTRCGNDLEHFIPIGSTESTLTASSLVAGSFCLVLHNGSPGINRVGVLLLGLSPEVHERTTHVRVLDPDRAVNVPGSRNAPLAATWLIRG